MANPAPPLSLANKVDLNVSLRRVRECVVSRRSVGRAKNKPIREIALLFLIEEENACLAFPIIGRLRKGGREGGSM